MQTVSREIDRALTLLRNKIREKGFSQLEVQKTLCWGRSYISQLLTKQKALRLEQILLILNVIDVDPADFFSELYHHPPGILPARGLGQDERQRIERLEALLLGLVSQLTDQGVIEEGSLRPAAAGAGKGGSPSPGGDSLRDRGGGGGQ